MPPSHSPLRLSKRFRLALTGLLVALLVVGAAPLAHAQTSAISINDVNVGEPNAGTTIATFLVTLSEPSAGVVTVAYETADGTATAPADYAPASGAVTFLPGVVSRPVQVVVNGDLVDEPDQTFFVNLSLSVNATIDDGQGRGTIVDNDAPPAASIADDSAIEGNAGSGNAPLAIALSGVSEKTVTIDFATTDGSATSPDDYTTTTGTATFAPGDIAETAVVPVVGDTLDEGNETFIVTLSSPGNATIADGQATGTILDDDPGPTISIDDVSVAEGNSGTIQANFTVSLSAASGQTVTVDYATANVTASAPADYAATAGTLTFDPGETQQTISVAVNGDLLDEADETFTVSLSGASNATILDGQGTGTITDDDATPSLSINDVTRAEGSPPTSTVDFTFTVTLSAASGQAITVAYATADGTATSPDDYGSQSGTLTFNPGQTSKTVVVTVVPDGDAEPDETFSVMLSDETGASLADAEGVGAITNDDGGVSLLTIDDPSVTEPNVGVTTLTFTITLSPISSQTVTVDWATADGTATAGVTGDYLSDGGTLTFDPGDTTKTVSASVAGDTLDEDDETLFVRLTNASNAGIGDGEGVGTITDNDDPPAASVDNVSLTEGNSGTTNATFTVTLSGASGRTITVDVATADGTATEPDDYTAQSGTLTFQPGETAKSVTVPVAGDTADEADETFTVTLSNPGNVTLADDAGAGTITDDDDPPSASIDDVTVTEGDTGTTPATFTVSLSQASGRDVTMDFATGDGTAAAPGDYSSATGALTIPAGETSGTIDVEVQGDTLDEADETFTVNLSTPGNVTLADDAGTGTITDEDDPPALSIDDVSSAEGNAAITPFDFTVSLSEASGQDVMVDFATADGMATAPGDYASSTGTLTINAGSMSGTVRVNVVGEVLAEPDETFSVNLTNPVNATAADMQGVGTITNDDGTPPSLSIDDVTVTEGNSGTTNATFTVTLSPAAVQQVTVDFATADSTAVSPADYTAGGGTLTFGIAEATKTVTVPVAGDVLDEDDETFTVNLFNARNATIGDAQGSGTITDDDSAPSLSINDVTVNEGDTGTGAANFTVSLSAVSGLNVTVNFATSNGTATAGADYAAASGTLAIPAGSASGTIAVTIGSDVVDEPDETFSVALTSPVNATLVDAQGLGTIVDNDPVAPPPPP
ncbi:MAG: Calx-beta domain-containing protein, partial [Actinomycetota bacterium]